jgi:hypothetical protein
MKQTLSYLAILFILFLCSGSSDLAADKNVMIGGWVFFSVAYFYFEQFIRPSFLILTAIFVTISGIYYISNGAYNEVTYLGFFIRIYLAYYCRGLCKEDFFKYFINIIFVLTCISLPFYLIQLANFDWLYGICNVFRAEDGIEIRHSAVIFTVMPIHEIRNCGFMWEPGAFAAVLILTIYINTFRQQETLFSRRNMVFIFAIITTQSTMGVSSLLIPISLILLKHFSKDPTLKQLAVIFVPAFLTMIYILFNNVDFLSKKIIAEIKDVEVELAFVEQGNRENFVVATTRTTSIILDMQTIKRYPLLGLGIDMKTTGKDKQALGELTQTACGLTVILLRFGAIGFITYIILYYHRAFFEERIHKAGWVFTILFILLSNDLGDSSLLHLFLF